MTLISIMRKCWVGQGWRSYVVGLRSFGDRLLRIVERSNSEDGLPGDIIEFDESLAKLWESL